MVVSFARRNSQTSTEGPYKANKIRVHLKDTCFFCGRNMSSANQTINHARRIHGYGIPSRSVGHKRPTTKEYEYVRDRNSDWDVDHIACPSCWFHCAEEDLDALYEHTREVHDPIKIEGTKKDGYESAVSVGSISSSRRSSRRAGSVPIKVEDEYDSATSGGATSGSNHRRGSSQDISNAVTTNISRKLDELTDLFKAFFRIY